MGYQYANMKLEPKKVPNLVVDIRQILNGHPQIQLAVLFGSLARNKACLESDLDLAVSADRPLDVNEKMQLIEALADLTGRPVDLVDLFTVGEPLLGQIIVGGQRILGDDTHYALLLSKHLFNQADFMPYQRRILRDRRMAWIGI